MWEISTTLSRGTDGCPLLMPSSLASFSWVWFLMFHFCSIHISNFRLCSSFFFLIATFFLFLTFQSQHKRVFAEDMRWCIRVELYSIWLPALNEETAPILCNSTWGWMHRQHWPPTWQDFVVIYRPPWNMSRDITITSFRQTFLTHLWFFAFPVAHVGIFLLQYHHGKSNQDKYIALIKQ